MAIVISGIPFDNKLYNIYKYVFIDYVMQQDS